LKGEVILKADDFVRLDDKWKRFFFILEQSDVLASVGVSGKHFLPKSRKRGSYSDVQKIYQIGKSAKIAEKFEEPIELLWIDGDHSHKGAKEDISNWRKFVIVGGIMAFHDYGRSGVTQAVDEFLEKESDCWEVVSNREVGSIFVLRRLK